MKTYYIKTFGCQMNDHDSQKMEAMLRQDGLTPARVVSEADVIVINTCSIREKSYHKAVSEIGRIGKETPDRKAVIAVTGCVVSHGAEAITKKFPYVDLVLGPDHIAALPRLARKIASEGRSPAVESDAIFGRTDGIREGSAVSLTDFKDISDYEFPASILSVDGRTGERRSKAYVTIMKGCDNACSFCIVPFTRGGEVSRASHDIIDEICRLEEQGVREVMLLGQNVNSYGKGLLEKSTFAGLIRRVAEETAIDRIRFTSPHPKDLSKELIEEYGENEKLCPHIHLPIQSGSNDVLKRMRRAYTRESYLRKVEALRKTLPEVAITTDIIVGFPGETEDDFQQTMSLMKEVDYDSSYSFSYSPRPKTEASTFADDVSLEEKKERLRRVQELQEAISLRKNLERIGLIEPVLVEGPSLEGRDQWMGRTPHGRIVNFNSGENPTGAILNMEIVEASPYSLKGRIPLC